MHPTHSTRIGRYPRDFSNTGTVGSHAGGGGGTRPCSTLSRTTSSKACRFRRQNRVSVETKVPFSKYLLTGAPPSTQGEIGAFLATAFDARVDVGLDRPKFGGLQHGPKIVLGHPTQHEVAVMRAGQAEQLGRE